MSYIVKVILSSQCPYEPGYTKTLGSWTAETEQELDNVRKEAKQMIADTRREILPLMEKESPSYQHGCFMQTEETGSCYEEHLNFLKERCGVTIPPAPEVTEEELVQLNLKRIKGLDKLITK